jgi:glutamine amidotransferase-like uncharacterized protein
MEKSNASMDVFNDSFSFLNEKFALDNLTFTPVLVEKTDKVFFEVLESSGFTAKKEHWQNKLDTLIQMGGSQTDFAAAFSSKNTGEESDFYLCGKIDFIKGGGYPLVGQIEFLKEFKKTVHFRDILIVTFRSGGKGMVEMYYNWETGIKTGGLSIKEFIKNPTDFVTKRM